MYVHVFLYVTPFRTALGFGFRGLSNLCDVYLFIYLLSINGHEFHNIVGHIPGTPLEILPIKMMTAEVNNHEVTPYRQVNTDRLADIKRMADETHLHELKTLNDFNGSDHTDLYICLTIIIFIILLILFLKYLYFTKPKIFQTFFKVRNDVIKNYQNVLLEEKVPEKTNSFIFSA